jgi:trimethylamine:corrinoid methyltransferase-like protein
MSDELPEDSKPRGSPWARELYELFAPVRESLKDYSEKEINDAIDEALRAYRAEKSQIDP